MEASAVEHTTVMQRTPRPAKPRPFPIDVDIVMRLRRVNNRQATYQRHAGQQSYNHNTPLPPPSHPLLAPAIPCHQPAMQAHGGAVRRLAWQKACWWRLLSTTGCSTTSSTVAAAVVVLLGRSRPLTFLVTRKPVYSIRRAAGFVGWAGAAKKCSLSGRCNNHHVAFGVVQMISG